MLRRRLMMQAKAPAEEAWSYQWDYTMGAPDTTVWVYPVGTGTATFDGDEGLHILSNGLANYAGLRLKNQAAWFGQKAVYEVEVKVISAGSNGFRIVCTSGSNGVSDNHGLQVTINRNYLNIKKGATPINYIEKNAEITYNEWHKVRLELNTIDDANKVYLDDALIATVSNADLSTDSASNVWCLAQYGEAYVKAVRYRKED